MNMNWFSTLTVLLLSIVLALSTVSSDAAYDNSLYEDGLYRVARAPAAKWMRFGKRAPQTKWMRFGKRSQQPVALFDEERK